MIPGIMGIMAGSVEGRSVGYLQSTDYGSGTTISNSINFGSEGASRVIVCAVHWAEGGFHRSLSSATIGGVSATIHVQKGHSGGATGLGAAIISAAVPSGTSGSVSVTFSSSITDCLVAAYRVNSMSISATGSDEAQATTQQLSVTIATPADGIIIAAYTGSTNTVGTGVSWTGVTEQYDTANTTRASGAFATGFASGNQVVTATQGTISDSGNDLVVTAWG
jgi:hypothetical protein